MSTAESPALCTVPRCRRDASTGHLCRADADLLGTWLSEISGLLDRLTDHLAPALGVWNPRQGSGGGLKSQRSIGNLDAMSLMDSRTTGDTTSPHAVSVPAILGGWAELVRDTRQLPGPTLIWQMRRVGAPAHLPSCTRPCDHTECAALTFTVEIPVAPTPRRDRDLLAAHLGWIISQDWAGDFYTEVRSVWGALRAAVGETRSRPAHRCPQQTIDGTPCRGTVYASKSAAWCASCGHAWSGFDLLRLAAPRQGVRHTEQRITTVPVPRPTVAPLVPDTLTTVVQGLAADLGATLGPPLTPPAPTLPGPRTGEQPLVTA